MSEKSLNLSFCSSFSEECDSLEATEVEDDVLDVITDLKDIQDELHRDIIKNCYDSCARFCKVDRTRTRLELIDHKLLDINDSINPNPLIRDDLVSNFGMSLKVESANNKLNETIKKHECLRKEWYSQEEHLNKLAKEVERKDDELQLQSIFCTNQGLILSKMLWKATNLNVLLDKLISNSKLALELVKTLDGCLYAFTQTYSDEMPEPSAEEYQYVLCLCGILSNLASVPDGRFLLTNQPVCINVFDQIINILPSILVPRAEDLKFVMLTSIHNLMICREGEEYAKSSKNLLQSLSECIASEQSSNTILLALKIMSNITSEIVGKPYLKYITNNLPIERLQELRKNKDDMLIRKQAKLILTNVLRMNRYYNDMEYEQIQAARLGGNKSNCKLMGTQTYTSKRTPEVLAYYVFTDQSKTSTSISKSSTDSSIDDAPEKVSTDEFYQPTSTTESLITPGSIFRNPKIVDGSYSFPLSKHHVKRPPHSAPVSSNRRQHPTRPQSPPFYNSRQFADKTSSSFLVHHETTCKKSIQTSYPINKKFNNKTVSTLCCPSTMSMPGNTINRPQEIEEPTSSISEEIQTVEYRVPQINLRKLFSITIGDNLQTTNRNNVGTTYVDKDNTGSIVTVFRISQSRAALLASDNSIYSTPFYSTISTNTSFPWETAMNNFFKVTATSKQSSSVETSTLEDNSDAFDVAYGGYESYVAKLKLKPQEYNIHDQLEMPSTSTGYYGQEKRYSPFVGGRDENATSSCCVLETKQPSVTKLEKTTSAARAVKSKECNTRKLRKKSNAKKKGKWGSGSKGKGIKFKIYRGGRKK